MSMLTLCGSMALGFVLSLVGALMLFLGSLAMFAGNVVSLT